MAFVPGRRCREKSRRFKFPVLLLALALAGCNDVDTSLTTDTVEARKSAIDTLSRHLGEKQAAEIRFVEPTRRQHGKTLAPATAQPDRSIILAAHPTVRTTDLFHPQKETIAARPRSSRIVSW